MDDPTERELVALADGVWLAVPLEVVFCDGVVELVDDEEKTRGGVLGGVLVLMAELVKLGITD